MRSLPMLATLVLLAGTSHGQVKKFVRYSQSQEISYGVLDGDQIKQLDKSPIEQGKVTGKTIALDEVKLLAPCEPGKVIAVGLNYQTHLGDRDPAAYPGLFLKLPTSIIATEEEIVFPEGARNVHYEGELVVVIGKKASKASKENAADYIFGITVGNDVSERSWQQADLQWFRAKASDTFGPMGPIIVQGLDHNDLQLTTRLNGDVVQSQRTTGLIFDVEEIISYVSQFVTLNPGDVIFTGTPGTTRRMSPGDTVEVELEGVGILRNRIATEGR